MRPRPHPALTPALALGLAMVATSAAAQPSPLPTAGPGGEEEPKKQGIAEAAPKTTSLLDTGLTLPPPRDRRKKFQVVTIDGYLRVRGDWLKNLNLGFKDDPTVGGAPYPDALGCQVVGAPCDDTVKTSNMRARFEPAIQLTDTIAVHSQLDVLDNIVLGNQVDTADTKQSIAVRRAWAEVATALGFLKFGRMPDHFGLGIMANSGRRADTDFASWETLWQSSMMADVGGTNPVGYDLDSDYGDSIDRLMFSGAIPGTPLRAAAALDWHGPGKYAGFAAGEGVDRDLDDNDDMAGWMLAVARIDAPADFAERVARGKLGLNYAARVNRVTQGFVYSDTLEATHVDYSAYKPQAWVKLGWRKFLVEAEVALEIGSYGDLTNLGIGDPVDVRSWGGVVRGSGRAVDDKLRYGLEVGAASGDERDGSPQGRTHLRDAHTMVRNGDTTSSRFVFDPDYEVDLILFRELIGAVSNAAYGKPWLSYDLTKSITFKAANITSGALRPVATPGNSTLWGTEFDFDIGYNSGGFHAGLAYGVLFPLAAMNHPANLPDEDGSDYFLSTLDDPERGPIDNTGDASTAHTFQARFAVEF